MGNSWKSLFYKERGKLFAVNFREYRKQVGKTGVGDPHFLAVQDVMFAVRRKHGAGAAIERVGARRRFRQRVRANDFSRCQSRQVFFLLLFGAEVNDGQHSNAAVRAPCGGKTGVLGDVIGDDGGSDFVHLETAVGLGNLDAAEAEVAGLFQQIAGNRVILMLDLLGLGQNFVDGKFFGRLPDHLVLLGKIFRGEYIGSLPLFEQEAAAENLGLRDCSRRHSQNLSTTGDTEEHGETQRDYFIFAGI